jgi:hypothetical protein
LPLGRSEVDVILYDLLQYVLIVVDEVAIMPLDKIGYLVYKTQFMLE